MFLMYYLCEKYPWKKGYDKPRQHIKKQRHHFVHKCPYSQTDGFSSGHIWMWELDHKEGWALKKWCFPTVVLEKTLESLLDCKESQPGHPKGNQSWIFTGRTDVEAETPLLWPTDAKSRHWKRPQCWERLKAKEEGCMWQRMRWLDSIHDSMETNLNTSRETVEDRGAWCAAVPGVTKSRAQLSNWTTTNYYLECLKLQICN